MGSGANSIVDVFLYSANNSNHIQNTSIGGASSAGRVAMFCKKGMRLYYTASRLDGAAFYPLV